MTVRPPRQLSSKLLLDSPSAALDYEIAQEKVSSLGRLGRRLEATLAALVEFDAASAAIEPSADRRQARTRLVAEAGHALWLLVVQRESIGLRDTRQLMRDYRVPADVQGRMGMLPPR